MSNLNERCTKILEILVRADTHTSLKELAGRTGVSRRSIYYDICNINDWLDEHGLGELVPEHGRGFLLKPDEKRAVAEAMADKDYEEYYQFLPEDRQKILITCIIGSPEPVYIEQLIDCLHVSRNTVFGDIKLAVQKLNEYSLSLQYEVKSGYRICGNPVQIRAIFILFYEELRPLVLAGLIPFLERKTVQDHYDRLDAISRELKLDYVEGSLDALALLLPVMYRHSETVSFPELRENEVTESAEYRQVCAKFPDLSHDEQIYLAIHLLGARLSVSTEEIFEQRSDQTVYGITKALVSEFEKVACVTFARRDELERALFIHIKSSLYRYQYGIQIEKPVTEDVVREYPNLFELTRRVTVFLEQMINLPIPDAEVAYLALHFGAFLKTTGSRPHELRIMIVCSSGVSTGNMLRREVQKLLPEANIVGVLPASRLTNAQEVCDLVISTVRINTVVPVLVVHPILTDEDRRYILSNSLVAAFNNDGFAKRLFEVVSKYVAPADRERLRADINQLLAGSAAEKRPILSEKDRGLPELLDLSRIRIVDTAVRWTDAIYLAGEPLLKNGAVIEHYLDAIVTQTMYYGPYMFITDHIMLAHAKPEDGVNRRDVSLASFRVPVPFPQGRKARIIIVLGAEDNEKHLKILSDLLTFAENEDNIRALEEAASAGEILRLFAGVLRK